MASWARHISVLLWSILCISTSLILMVLLFNRKVPLIMARTIWAPGILWLYGVKLEISGAHHIDKKRPIIFVSNHLSYLDIPCLFSALPVNLHFMAKKQLKKVPFLGWFMMATGMIFVDRKNKNKALKSIDKAAHLIKQGRNVLIFPEGSRSVDGEVGNFKKGAFQLALKSGSDIIPVALEGTDKIWSGKSFRTNPGAARLVIGSPIENGSYSSDNAILLSKQVRQKIISLFATKLTVA